MKLSDSTIERIKGLLRGDYEPMSATISKQQLKIINTEWNRELFIEPQQQVHYPSGEVRTVITINRPKTPTDPSSSLGIALSPSEAVQAGKHLCALGGLDVDKLETDAGIAKLNVDSLKAQLDSINEAVDLAWDKEEACRPTDVVSKVSKLATWYNSIKGLFTITQSDLALLKSDNHKLSQISQELEQAHEYLKEKEIPWGCSKDGLIGVRKYSLLERLKLVFGIIENLKKKHETIEKTTKENAYHKVLGDINGLLVEIVKNKNIAINNGDYVQAGCYKEQQKSLLELEKLIEVYPLNK